MLLTRFVHNIVEKKLFAPSDRLLIAVSGGVDSVVLCDLCHNAGFAFEVAHANFQLRGEESEIDECFVKGIADRYRVPFHVKKFNTTAYAERNKVSVQVAARELRYEWFDQLLNSEMKFLLTAHHADDNVETVLMNFFRGTGIAGLRGIVAKHDYIIRPLLFASKKEIVNYAKEMKLSWREDASNSSDKYSRNYFRNAIIPLVYKIYPEAEANLLQNISRFAEADELYQQAIALHKKKLIEYKGNEVHLPVLKLKKLTPVHTILFEVIKDYGFTSHQVNEVMHLADGAQGSYVQSPSHRIIKNRNWLIIAPNNNENGVHHIIDEGEREINFSGGLLTVTTAMTDNVNFSNDQHIAELDHRKIRFPLLLRKWKTGDYFYPLGMKKKKKISRFLIDNKLSKTDKEKLYVVESDKKICWVVGMRIDERFKITAATGKVLKLIIS